MVKKDKTIQNKLRELKPHQQKTLENLLNLFSKLNNLNVDGELREHMVCRACNGTHFVKNGGKDINQRYKCKGCGSTQAADYNTPLYGLRLKEKWNDFVYLMLDSDSKLVNRVVAEKLDINTKTSQAWRHKFLSALNQAMDIDIDGAIEVDEVILPFKVKGNIGEEKFDVFYGRKSLLNIPSQLRLDEIDKQENKDKTFFMCVHNRQGDFDFLPLRIQPKGTVSSTYIADAFDKLNIKNKTVITDNSKPMTKYLQSRTDLSHLKFNSFDIKKGKMVNSYIHNNNINNTMSLFEEWIGQFRGYSTKYIWNYLKWFRFVRMFRKFKDEIVEEITKNSLLDTKSFNRHSNIFNYYKDFLYA